MPTAEEVTWSFSTGRLPPQQRATALYGLRDRDVLPFEPLLGLNAQAEITKLIFPGASILSGTLSGLRQIGSRNDREVVFSLNLGGVSTVRHVGRDLTLRDGGAALMSCPEGGFAMHRPTPSKFISLRLQHKELMSLAPTLGDAVMREIPGRAPPLRLLTSYLQCLDATQAGSAELSRAVAAHIYDLVALSIGASRDTVSAASGRGVRAARLLGIKTDIIRNFADPDLSVTAIAARHGVTPRYVHKLFASQGLTFSEFVLDSRLTAAHRLLSDRRLVSRPIISVAFDVGFSDLSYFNRTFRRRYDATPTDVRYLRQD